MKRWALRILTAAGFCLLAVVYLWFLPLILQQMMDGSWDRHKRQIRRWELIRERFGFEKWKREENETRHKRVWKNRNNFYK